jgi:MFS family permease
MRSEFLLIFSPLRFCLCGCGYMLDLAWAQTFGLIMPRVQIELGISGSYTAYDLALSCMLNVYADSHYGDIFSVFSAGLTVGALTWGVLVDIIGRRWAFNLTVATTAFFGLLLGACDTYLTIMSLTFFVGFGLGGNIPIDATIVMEFLPSVRDLVRIGNPC